MAFCAFGDVTIHRVIEFEKPFIAIDKLFEQATPDTVAPHRHWLEPNALCPNTGKVILPVQSYVVQTPQHTILIDTCVGCGKTSGTPDWHERDDATWLQNLRTAGFTPENIDYVFCTHLHSDHCGWNTRLLDGRWVPTFPNAKYILAKTEVENSERGNSPTFQQSVLPILQAGQAQLVETDFALNDTIWLTPTPGHTAGHVCVNIQSGGQRAIMIGDILHSPIQFAHPDWSIIYDDDGAQAVKTRQTLLDAHCETDTIFLTAHLPSPSAGHVVSHPERPFDFRYLNDHQNKS